MRDELLHILAVFRAYGSEPTDAGDGTYRARCPVHKGRRSAAVVLDVDDRGVWVETPGCNCLPGEIARTLGIQTDRAGWHSYVKPSERAGVLERAAKARAEHEYAAASGRAGQLGADVDTIAENLRERLARDWPHPKRRNRYRCPHCHDERHGGVKLDVIGGEILLYCHGCQGNASVIMPALELSPRDLYPPRPEAPALLAFTAAELFASVPAPPQPAAPPAVAAVETPATPGAETWDAELLEDVRDGAWLDGQTFAPLRWAVPGVIPEGFAVLAGAPKVGKSWFILAVLLAVAAGGRVLGKILTPAGRVLYLAMEDGDRRMQDRCRALMHGAALPARFHYKTRIKPGTIVAVVEAFLRKHPDTTLIVIDTLGKVMPAAANGETTYGRDYRVGSVFHEIAVAHPGLAVVALHHDRKAAAEDFVEKVSGTNGLTGAADTVIVLTRPRTQQDGALHVTGRDVTNEASYAVTMRGGSWVLDGEDLDDAARKLDEGKVTAGVGDRMADVLQMVNAHPEGVSPMQVAETLDLSPGQARVYLARAYDTSRIDKSGRGVYVPRPLYTPVTSVTFDSKDHSKVTVVTGDIEGVSPPACLHCLTPLHPALAATGVTVHPTCEP